MTRALVYNRKSRGELEDLQKHKQELLSYCIKNEFEYVYFEEIASSVDEERAEYLKLLKEIQSGKYDILIITDLSRLTRNLKQQLELFELLESNNMIVHSLLDGIINPQDSMGEMMSVIKGMFNQSSYKETSKKMHLGRLQSVRNGKWVGSAPYGYIKDKNTLKLILDPVEAPVVARIFREVIEGYSITEIYVRLKNDGIKTRKGNEFHPATISNLLERRTYIGETNFKSDKFDEEIILKNTHEGIVSIEEFVKVRNILANKQHFRTRTHAITSPLDKTVHCGKCGRLMQVNLMKKKYIYLQQCCAYKYGEQCNNKGCSLNYILPRVYKRIKERRKVIQTQLETLKSGGSNERIDRLNKELKGLTKQLKNMESEKEDLINYLLKKVISETVYTTKNKELEMGIKQLQQRINDTLEAIANSNTVNDVTFLEGLLQHIDHLESKPVDEQNRILKQLLNKIVYIREGDKIILDYQFK